MPYPYLYDHDGLALRRDIGSQANSAAIKQRFQEQAIAQAHAAATVRNPRVPEYTQPMGGCLQGEGSRGVQTETSPCRLFFFFHSEC
jgi:hypothetical protein